MKYMSILEVLLVFKLVLYVNGGRPCASMSFGDSSVVCVCNTTYCDTLDPLRMPAKGSYILYESSKSGKRLESTTGPFIKSIQDSGLKFTFNVDKKYQQIKGFGGAVTDSATVNILSLTKEAQENLLRSYFSEDGIEYNVIRVPMASCDFSLHVYTYADSPDDFDLKNFSLAKEDVEMKIPLIQRAISMSKRPISLFASPWTSPAWMKTNEDVSGKGTLKGAAGDKYHKTWANYFVSMLSASKVFQANIQFFSALDGVISVLSDMKAARYINGIAVHWYMDEFAPAGITLSTTHKLFPEYYLFATEACTGFLLYGKGVQLGSWERGNQYSEDIIKDLNNYVTGWTDWNIALDLKGGPTWVENYVDSPVIVDTAKDTFYKQPMFYHLAHFSKFIPEGSQHVGLDSPEKSKLETVAFLRPDGAATLVVLNQAHADVKFVIWDPEVGYINAVSHADSIQTYVWRRS
ncbi:lysosomal acid glucosylceramidase [Protopterus annectens]|uniref:lysosomal acid glucosylceramidase n=1 Tax=Protopterus annectens TaxID=7888 RepID=UPI001CFB5610|nr:lysosomal acid glucosylceramidase [Protopterus annectens]